MTSQLAVKMLVHLYREEVAKRGRQFENSDNVAANIEKVMGWLYNSDKQGLLLCGTVGNGKTTLAKATVRLINYYNKNYVQGAEIWRESVKEITAYDLTTYARDNKEKYASCKNALRLFIDDVGIEESGVKNYGNVICPFAELLFDRYRDNRLTIITTNLTMEQIKEKYDSRVADRMMEMFWRMVFTSASYRK